jgi:hypothetical protein
LSPVSQPAGNAGDLVAGLAAAGNAGDLVAGFAASKLAAKLTFQLFEK